MPIAEKMQIADTQGLRRAYPMMVDQIAGRDQDLITLCDPITGKGIYIAEKSMVRADQHIAPGRPVTKGPCPDQHRPQTFRRIQLGTVKITSTDPVDAPQPIISRHNLVATAQRFDGPLSAIGRDQCPRREARADRNWL